MQVISTGAEHLLTDDAVADAVLDYAAVLARAGSADTVRIPVLGADGLPTTARLLIGPASQITLLPGGQADRDLPGSAAAVDRMVAESDRLEGRAPETGPVDEYFPDFDPHP